MLCLPFASPVFSDSQLSTGMSLRSPVEEGLYEQGMCMGGGGSSKVKGQDTTGKSTETVDTSSWEFMDSKPKAWEPDWD